MQKYVVKGITFLKRIFGLCTKIGQDQYKNSYYQDRYILFTTSSGPKRWVVYKDQSNIKVCPSWHLWLYYTIDSPLENGVFIAQEEKESNQSAKTKKKYNAWIPS